MLMERLTIGPEAMVFHLGDSWEMTIKKMACFIYLY